MILVGLMSGTSVDGIDAAVVEIEGTPGDLRWQLRAFCCYAWEPSLRDTILNACRPDTPLQTVVGLNVRVGEVFAEAAKAVIAQSGLPYTEIDAIASHGQTLWHQPEPLLIASSPVTGTFQIGEPAVIAARTGCRVIADFRPADMAVGGHGAPLVPYVDYLLFASPEESRAVQNIGGIGNVTFLPQGATEEAVLAFDTGTGNMLIDALVQELTEGRVRYDEAGAWAAQGESDFALLSEVLEMPFFAQPPPRTTGREMFGRDFTEEFLRKACARSLSEADILATATEITVESIAQAYERFLPPLERVILGGGGVHNTYLMERLKQRLPRPIFQTHQDFGLPNDAKEAVAFALMGYETLHLRPANLPSATGAKRRAILGKVAYPPV